MIPVLAVSVIVVLAFMIIYGMGHEGKLELHKGIKGTIGVLAAIVIAVTVLILTGSWDYLIDLIFYSDGSGSVVLTNIIFIVIIIVAIGIVVWGGKEKKPREGEKEKQNSN